MPGTDRNVALIHSPQIEEYAYPPECPFTTQRAGMARKIIADMGLLNGAHRREVPPTPASREALERFHAPDYLDILKHTAEHDLDVEGIELGLGTPDSPVFPQMYDYAVLAAGGTLVAADLLLAGDADIAFNPSGGYHHAHPRKASGFCYINDMAVACAHLAEHGKRVFYLDIDVHHGDGVEEAFYDRADVMTLSLHETGHCLFPGTGFENNIGVGDGTGYAANLPLPPYTYDDAYLRAFNSVALPLIGAFKPDVIALELGMDTLAGDPLAHLELTNNAHAEMLAALLKLDTPLMVTGGGGYNMQNTARGWALAWSVFCGEDNHDDMLAGLGGVMMETTDWVGGLRDRALAPSDDVRSQVAPAVEAAIEAVKQNVFSHHGL
jgi:acetoin utilization protein AcuC